MARTVRTLGFDPISQDDFPTGYGELRQWLREQLDACEGLIQLVGEGYGAEPPEVDPEYGRISYTQFEFLYAHKQKKKTWIIVIGKDFSRDKALDQLDLPRNPGHPDSTTYQTERHSLQQDYLAQLKQQNHLRHTANNPIELDNVVLRLRDELRILRQEWGNGCSRMPASKLAPWPHKIGSKPNWTKLRKCSKPSMRHPSLERRPSGPSMPHCGCNGTRSKLYVLRCSRGQRNTERSLPRRRSNIVVELAARDRAYAHEIAVFRKAVEDIVATPEGVAALARFNAGDEPGALTVLDQLRAAHNAARTKRADLESAEEGRRIATLALEVRTKGKLTTAHVIARYEEVTRLDPGVHWDWVELGRLYEDSGNLPAALRAGQAAARTAEDERDKSVANDAIGDVLVAQGDLLGALKAFRASLAIREALAARDGGNTQWQRDLYVSYWRLADLAEQRKAPKEAGAYWSQAYEVLSSIEKRGLHVSPEDKKFLAILSEKVRLGVQ